MVDVNLIPKEYKEKREGIGISFPKIGGLFLILLILGLLLYGGLLFYQKKLNDDISVVKEEIATLDQKRDPEMEKSLLESDKKLKALKEIYGKHLYWSELFNKIKEMTVPQVYFSQTNLDFLAEANVNLSGNALSYTTLAKQIKSFQDEASVEKVNVSNISLSSEGGIDFELKVIFSKDILLK